MTIHHVCPNCRHHYEEVIGEKINITPEQVEMIIDLCCDHFNVPKESISKKDRKKKIAKARHIAMYLIYGEGKHGIFEIKVGERFERDHTTVLNARNRCKDALFTKGDVYEDILILQKKSEEILTRNTLKVAI